MIAFVAGAAGYVVAALCLGLWWGGRGRRLDAQRREGMIQVDRPKRAVVRQPDGGAVPEEVRSGVELAAAREKYIEDAVREGYDPDAAAADFDAIMARLYSDESGML